ncbi:MAG TPA: class I SAM-dependent methyltransferase [Terrimicrobiaceae bacterium]
MATLEENRFWDKYDWPRGGDEWTDQADFCGMAYPLWKRDIVDAFIVPSITEDSTVLELAMGHGRWTPFLAERARRYIGVDFSPSSVNFCRKHFAHLANVTFFCTDGRTLSPIASNSVQFVWSFDSFVHIEPDVTEGYMAEIARVLSPGGQCTIHHPGTPSREQRVNGGRSALSRSLFAHMANTNGLRILSQRDSWGPRNRSNTKLFADCISTIEKPIEAPIRDVPHPEPIVSLTKPLTESF